MLFVRNFGRVCSQSRLSACNSFCSVSTEIPRGTPSFPGNGKGGKEPKCGNKHLVYKLMFPRTASLKDQCSQKLRREYHQSCAQPGFRAEQKRCHFWAFSAYFPVFGARKTRAQPWYARKSGKSPGQKTHFLEIASPNNFWESLHGGFQRPWVYPYPRVSDFAGRNSDHDPSKTQTKTQTTPDSVFIGERRNSDHGLSFWEGKTQTMVWMSVSQGVGVDPVLMKTHFLEIASPNNFWESLHGGLANGGLSLEVLVHDCLRLSSLHIFGPKGHKCARL